MVSTTRNADWNPPVREPRPIKFQKLSDVEFEEVKWLWYPYIPAGKLSLLEGDPGQGKSWITCSLAADLSAGRPLPGQTKGLPPQKVLMLSAEDGLGDTIRPRVEALQGNMDNIYVSDDYFILDEMGIKEMEELMKITAATIVFMDPIVAYMGSHVDMHRANEVRGLMTALAEAAKRTGSAIVAVRHLRKASPGKGAGKAIYSGIGSIDFTAAVRSVMQVQETKAGTKFVYHAKHNLTPKGTALGYTIGDNKFHWTGPLSEADTIDVKISTKPKASAQAEQFLFDLLRDGPVPAAELYTRAAQAGISNNSLNRVKKGLAQSYKGPDGWVWVLEERAGIDGLRAKTLTTEDREVERLVEMARARLSPSG